MSFDIEEAQLSQRQRGKTATTQFKIIQGRWF